MKIKRSQLLQFAKGENIQLPFVIIGLSVNEKKEVNVFASTVLPEGAKSNVVIKEAGTKVEALFWETFDPTPIIQNERMKLSSLLRK